MSYWRYMNLLLVKTFNFIKGLLFVHLSGYQWSHQVWIELLTVFFIRFLIKNRILLIFNHNLGASKGWVDRHVWELCGWIASKVFCVIVDLWGITKTRPLVFFYNRNLSTLFCLTLSVWLNLGRWWLNLIWMCRYWYIGNSSNYWNIVSVVLLSISPLWGQGMHRLMSLNPFMFRIIWEVPFKERMGLLCIVCEMLRILAGVMQVSLTHVVYHTCVCLSVVSITFSIDLEYRIEFCHRCCSLMLSHIRIFNNNFETMFIVSSLILNIMIIFLLRICFFDIILIITGISSQ